MWRIQRSHAAGSDVKCPAAGDRAISFEASVFELLLQQRASGELLRVLDLFSKAVSREERDTLGDEIQLYRQSWCNVSFGWNTATGPSRQPHRIAQKLTPCVRALGPMEQQARGVLCAVMCSRHESRPPEFMGAVADS